MNKARLAARMLAVLAAPAAVSAQDEPEQLPRAIVAVVDVDRVSSETLFGQSFTQRLTELQTTLEGDLTERRTRVEADQTSFQDAVEAFQAERETMTDADAATREAELRARQESLQDLIDAAQVDAQAAQRRLQNETNRLLDELNAEIRPHVSAVVEELGIDILLPVSQTVLHEPELDITARVIERADSAFEAERGPAPGAG